jgi:hypothetical protein
MLGIPKSTFTMCIHNGPLAEAETVFFEMFIWEVASLQTVFWALGLPTCAGCLDFHKETGRICCHGKLGHLCR